jgi:hypothetical protein
VVDYYSVQPRQLAARAAKLMAVAGAAEAAGVAAGPAAGVAAAAAAAREVVGAAPADGCAAGAGTFSTTIQPPYSRLKMRPFDPSIRPGPERRPWP